MKHIRVLFLGDVVGATGCAMIKKHLPDIIKQNSIHVVVVNGENSSPAGRGITPVNMAFFKSMGVHVVTSGNHIWYKREIYPYLSSNNDLLRPANFPSSSPGGGYVILQLNGYSVAIINLQGRIFMKEQIECPFKTADSLLTYIKSRTSLIFVDFHAEATSEKKGMGYFLDGRISGLVGTHTHVPTADEQILPKGTAYVTDLGMAGALDSMLGMKKEPIIENFITQMPTQFSVQTEGPGIMTGVWIEAEVTTGRALDIQRVKICDYNLVV